MLRVRYFSFGSNLLRQRLAWRIDQLGNVPQGESFTLHNYKLVFNAGVKFCKYCFANIMFEQGAKVEGLLYDLNERQLRHLDMYEALYERKYFYIDANTLGCTYVALPGACRPLEKKPELSYLNIILEGCRLAGLDWTYNKLLEYKKLNYKLKRNRNVKN